MSYFDDLFSLVFPEYCAGCDQPLLKQEEALCLTCLASLHRTGMHLVPNNKLERVFWGRVQLYSAAAFLRMPKGGIVHQLIHELKYNNNQAVGLVLGRLFGLDLAVSPRMKDFDLIVPVPLHPKKLAMRGYNQCDSICEGMSSSMGVPVSKNNLVRIKFNPTQTKRSRFSRWKNVESIFHVQFPQNFQGRHILLVDDVITTGATIEACTKVMEGIPGLKVSVCSLAIPV